MNTRAANLVNYLEASVERFPERIAVVDPDGRQVTYQQLNSRAERIAAFLGARGIKPGDRVALLMPKGANTVTAIFGVLKAGAAYVPIDWTAPAARARAILADCKTRAVFADIRVAGEVLAGASPSQVTVIAGATEEQVRASGLPGAVGWDEVLQQELPARGQPERSRDDLAYILYTSGSTGVPKGVMLSHGNALSFVDWCSSEFRPNEEDRFGNHAPFHFDLSVLDLYVAFKHGASVHIVDEETGKNPKELAAFISRRHLTVWYSTPSILHLLASFGNLGQLDFSALRLVLFAGEVFPIKHLRALTNLLPRPRYYNLYGPTETNVCTWFPIPSTIAPERIEPFPIGHPCSHCSAMVADAEGKPVRRGEEGTLLIAGESVFQGYWNRQPRTSLLSWRSAGEAGTPQATS
jgi:amino acid adenylation domain-containing protein